MSVKRDKNMVDIVDPDEYCGCFFRKRKNVKKVLPVFIPSLPPPLVQLQQPRRFTRKLYNPRIKNPQSSVNNYFSDTYLPVLPSTLTKEPILVPQIDMNPVIEPLNTSSKQGHSNLLKQNLPNYSSQEFDDAFLNHIIYLMSFKRKDENEKKSKYNFFIQDDQQSIMVHVDSSPVILLESLSDYVPASQSSHNNVQSNYSI